MKYSGFETLKEALDAHKLWRDGAEGGKRADLRGADLRGADLRGAYLSGADLRDAYLRDAYLSGAYLSGADLRDAYLSGAYLRGAYLPAGYKWEVYLAEVVPALCTAGGVALQAVAAAWDCHTWVNCPMAVAFGVEGISGVPPLYRREAEFFVQLFDARLIPKPALPEATVAS